MKTKCSLPRLQKPAIYILSPINSVHTLLSKILINIHFNIILTCMRK